MHDLVIKGGTVVDGTGRAGPHRRRRDHRRRRHRGRHGRRHGRARRSTPTALLVTPGFVDIHTHFDGQVTWDPLLTPIVLARRHHGRDGQLRRRLRAGRARPARVADRADGGRRGHPRRRALGRASSGGGRRSPSTSTRSTRCRRRIDVGTQVPHGAVRGYVMGERGAKNEPATADDIEAMARIVTRGHRRRRARLLDQSARSRTWPSTASRCPARSPPRTSCSASVGCSASSAPACSSSRPPARSARTSPRPSARWTGCAGSSAAIGRPVTFALTQNDHDPDAWRAHARAVRRGRGRRRAGAPAGARPHRVAAARACRRSTRSTSARRGRPIGLLPWPSRWRASQATPSCARAWSPRSTALERRPDRRRVHEPERIFSLGDPPDYEPPPSSSVAGIAGRTAALARGRCFYDLLLDDGGRELLNAPLLNYTRRQPRRRRARCSCTRRPRWASATAARTPARRATRARRRSCSRTGRATARTTASRSRGPCTR